MSPGALRKTMLVLTLLGAAGCGSSGPASKALAATSSVPATSNLPTSNPAASVAPTTEGLGTTTVSGATTSTRVVTTTATTIPAGAFELTEKDNARTLTVAKSARIVVVLSSTYWTFAPPSNAAVLHQDGPAAVTPSPFGTCVPGGGCGTVLVTYEAIAAGGSQITASRVSCGEAIRCTGTNGSYAVTIKVTGG